MSGRTARVERKKDPLAVHPWTAILGGTVRSRRHFLTREAAINEAAAFLTVFDERAVKLRDAYQKELAEIRDEYVARLSEETPA